MDMSSLIAGMRQYEQRQINRALKAVDTIAAVSFVGDAQQLAPVLTGALKASGTAEPATFDGSKIAATFGFNTDYAAAVHERLDLHHDQGSAKFLETSIRENTPKLIPFVAAQLEGD